jgi:type I restriction enzyme S subunit
LGMKPVAFKVRQLQDIMTLEKGKPPVQQPYLGQDAELYLTPEYLRGKAAAEPVKPGANAVRVLDGDIIVLWDGSNAGEFFRARKGILASTMSRIGYNDAFDKDYFFYAVKNWEAFLKSQTSGSGIPHVDKEVLGRIGILQFATPEQTKIADILSTVDLAIEQTEALIAKQQRIKTGLMQDLLTRGIDEHGNLRSERTHQFKDSPLGRIPSEWEVKSLGSALHETGGCLRTGPFGSQLHAHEYVTEGVPVIMPQDIVHGQVQVELVARVTETKAQTMTRYRVQSNDVVFSRRGDLSRAAAMSEREQGWLCGTGCFMLRVPANRMDAQWLAHAYRYELVQRQIEASAVGSMMPSLNNAVMESLLIAFPECEEQREIASRISTVDLVIQNRLIQCNKLHSLKTALMQDLLTGKVRVTPLLDNEEVSSE